MFCETGKGMVQAYTLFGIVKVSNTCNQYNAYCSTPTAELEPRQSEVVPGATVRLLPTWITACAKKLTNWGYLS